jgi:hypothetical protein
MSDPQAMESQVEVGANEEEKDHMGEEESKEAKP